MSSPSNGDSRAIHILFVGAGAVGCFYASRLHHPTHSIYVSLVCRSNYPVIAQSGVQLQTRNFGPYHFQPHAVYSSISHAASSDSKPPQGWDYVVVTTKALPDLIDDSATIAPVVTERETCIVIIQNGFGVEAPHRKRFPQNPILSGVTIVSAELISPGTVRQNRWTRLSLGPYSDGMELGSSPTAEKQVLLRRGAECGEGFVRMLREYGGVKDAEAYDEVGLQSVRWHKICINAAMNPSAVLSGGLGPSLMLQDPELRAHLKGCMEEVFAAAPAVLGRPLPEKLARPEQILNSAARNEGGKPSMLVDWEAGRPMELEVILGQPVRIARERGCEMGRLQALYALLRSAQRRREEEEEEKKGAKI